VADASHVGVDMLFTYRCVAGEFASISIPVAHDISIPVAHDDSYEVLFLNDVKDGDDESDCIVGVNEVEDGDGEFDFVASHNVHANL
jgi:hypothetical protein